MYFCKEVLGYKDLVADIHNEIGEKFSEKLLRLREKKKPE